MVSNLRLFVVVVAFSAACLSLVAQNVYNVRPGPDVRSEIQEALILMEPGDTLQLAPGVFRLSDDLSLRVDGVSIKGAGMHRTILQFAHQKRGSQGLLVTSNDVVLEDFAVEDTPGDGIKAQGCENIVFRNIRVAWTKGPDTENGAYGIYPVECRGVLVEKSEVRGASDAGIYVGQSSQIVVRRNVAEENVAGIEIENSYYADVYENTATGNTGGILAFDLPDLPQQGGHHVRIFDNVVKSNNLANFGRAGNIIADLPAGTGIVIMAVRDVEVFNNDLDDHGSFDIAVTSYSNETDDEGYDPLPDRVQIHGNTFGTSGHAPDVSKLADVVDAAGGRLANIVWDGVGGFWETLGASNGRRRVVLGDNAGSKFLNLDMVWYYLFKPLHNPSREEDKFRGEITPLPPVNLNSARSNPS